MLYWDLYRPQRSCGQGNVFTFVCLSTGGEGVCLSACWDAIPPPRPSRHPSRDQGDPPGPGRPPWDQADHLPRPGRHPPPGPGTPPRDQADPPGSGRPTPLGPGRHPPGTRQTPPRTRQTSPGSRLQHTVYEQPVRILLECILVVFTFGLS